MIILLKRHETQVLLNPGHTQAEVACLAKVSERSVRRIAAETAVEHVDDRQERVQRRIGRPRKAERFPPLVEQLLKETAEDRATIGLNSDSPGAARSRWPATWNSCSDVCSWMAAVFSAIATLSVVKIHGVSVSRTASPFGLAS